MYSFLLASMKSLYKKFLLISGIVLSSMGVTHLSAQIIFSPMESNTALSIYKKAVPRSERTIIVINVPAGKSDTSAYFYNLLNEIIDLKCSAFTNGGTVSIDSNKIIYKANNVSQITRDTACFNVDYDDTSHTQEQIKIEFVVRPLLQLPFFDDFNYEGPYPDNVLWTDKTVFVNNTFSKHPPTVGMASFDGLDAFGTPYGGAQGIADMLTSGFINLKDNSEGDNIHLTFYAQPKGLGLSIASRDSLLVQFKNDKGVWITKLAVSDTILHSREEDPAFVFYSIVIKNEDNNYFHDNFQFRFLNYNARQGSDGLWQVDYIKLRKETLPVKQEIADVAFMAPPDPFTYPYSQMPWWQFKGFGNTEIKKEGADWRIDFRVNNLFNTTLTADPSKIKIEETTSNTVILDNITLLEVPPITTENQRDVPPGLHNYNRKINIEGPLATLQALPGTGIKLVKTTYSFVQKGEPSVGIPAILNNNTVSSTTRFDEDFAYDDGSGEFKIQAASVNPGSPSIIAVKFHANVEDSIGAIRLYIPRFKNNISNQQLNLKIWQGSLDNEIHTEYGLSPYYADTNLDTLQGFTTYVMTDLNTHKKKYVPIVPGDFYVGWQQVTFAPQNEIPVGYDRNSPGGFDKVFLYYNNQWLSLKDYYKDMDGSVMIRPVMGPKIQYNTPTKDVVTYPINLYPNPTTGVVNIEIPDMIADDMVFDIYNSIGRKVFSQKGIAPVDMSGFAAGLYYIRGTHKVSNNVYIGKISVFK